ncbi:MAG: R3H domain-containing nucleic acid-binding protein [Candidatus Wildermuthbacteria bacterium]|nr:R3H domain-containing nucleic acid-binding protein [Candidatus Wildermuthbacteria bacterium]
MIERTVLETIKEVAEMLLEKLQIKGTVKALEAEEESVRVEVETEEPQLLIGEQGQALLEVQHVVRLIARKKLEEAPLIALDINEYRKSRETYLRELANTAADEVALLKKEKELPAMSSQDRRIVHMVISERQDVSSESMGEEPERRIVVRIKEKEEKEEKDSPNPG